MTWQIAVVFSLTATAFFCMYAGSTLGQDKELKGSSALKWFLYCIGFLTITISVASTEILVSYESNASRITDVVSLLQTEYLMFIPFLTIAFAYAILIFIWHLVDWLMQSGKIGRGRRK